MITGSEGHRPTYCYGQFSPNNHSLVSKKYQQSTSYCENILLSEFSVLLLMDLCNFINSLFIFAVSSLFSKMLFIAEGCKQNFTRTSGFRQASCNRTKTNMGRQRLVRHVIPFSPCCYHHCILSACENITRNRQVIVGIARYLSV